MTAYELLKTATEVFLLLNAALSFATRSSIEFSESPS